MSTSDGDSVVTQEMLYEISINNVSKIDPSVIASVQELPIKFNELERDLKLSKPKNQYSQNAKNIGNKATNRKLWST
jgi:hypothetical protein